MVTCGGVDVGYDVDSGCGGVYDGGYSIVLHVCFVCYVVLCLPSHRLTNARMLAGPM